MDKCDVIEWTLARSLGLRWESAESMDYWYRYIKMKAFVPSKTMLFNYRGTHSETFSFYESSVSFNNSFLKFIGRFKDYRCRNG